MGEACACQARLGSGDGRACRMKSSRPRTWREAASRNRSTSQQPVILGVDMTLPSRCQHCGGSGGVECSACKCGRCLGKGQVISSCPNCNEGQRVCSKCGGAGRVKTRMLVGLSKRCGMPELCRDRLAEMFVMQRRADDERVSRLCSGHKSWLSNLRRHPPSQLCGVRNRWIYRFAGIH
jgi:RecJ-like exonuclease